MKRSALIIESSNVKGCKYLSGAVKDVENWHQFLRREIAGAWENDEIHVMHKPRAEVVVNFINQHNSPPEILLITKKK